MKAYKLIKQFVSIWIAISFALPAQAAIMCDYVFQDPAVRAREVDFGLRSTTRKIATPIELIKYRETQKALYETLDKIQPERKEQIENLLSAVEFFDYQHTANHILTNFLDGKRSALDFTNLYDRSEAISGAPFKGFLKARDNYLRKEKPEVSAQLLLGIHKNIMQDGVEGIRPEQLGVLRNVHLVGNAIGSNRLKDKEVEAIKANPYLYFETKEVTTESGLKGIWSEVKIWGKIRGMISAPSDRTLSSGRIHYPHVNTPKQATIDLIKETHPDVYQAVMTHRQITPQQKAPPELEQAFTKALLEQLFIHFSHKRAQLGEIKIGVNEAEYIDIVADFQRDLVAIHPVTNGNGRTTRLLMNYLLTKEGLPPVRLVDPYLDVQISKVEWREYVHKGVLNSAQLHADIAYRIQQGLTVEYAPDLIFPGLPENVAISIKKQNSDKPLDETAYAKVDSAQFNAFLKTIIEAHPDLRQELKNNHLQTMSRLAELFVEHYQSKTIRYIHDKDGDREVALRFVDPDFIDLFGVSRAFSKKLWLDKISRWYDRDLLVWRGLSSKTNEYSNEQLLSYFMSPSSHLLSNSGLKALRNGKSIIEAAKEDFKTYNRELLEGDVVEMAIDHHRTGPRYGTSYGYSTSKRESVGKAFAMGAMVIGEYGKHADPALQVQLKSRINVASFRALKDVDLGRLKAFDSEFSYIYGRQAEVMGIGGTDADAVVLIQKINTLGEVTETLMRNFDKPDEVLVIDGRYVPGEGPLAESRILERYQLNIKETPIKTHAQPILAIKKSEPAKPVQNIKPDQPAKVGLLKEIIKKFKFW